ncbi:hypothetical protein, partial [Bradyrhizobium sp. SZCCHNRI1005]|uniref:hypothetical protein n=1 Tax=Bradyrhizobium sp. SZCCHNRI1005 TaxID=3057276 RepID=UPI0028EFF1F2
MASVENIPQGGDGRTRATYFDVARDSAHAVIVRLTGRPVVQGSQRLNRDAAAYSIARSSRALTAECVVGFSHKPHHRIPATDTARVMLISFTLIKSEGAGKARRRLTPAARLREKMQA